MSISSQIIYTRSELKALKEETDRQIHLNCVHKLVVEITNSILSIAKSSNNTTYFKSIVLSSNPENKIVMDTIAKLKEQFIDVSIEYKSQTDLRTGKEFNQGIYIDWN